MRNAVRYLQRQIAHNKRLRASVLPISGPIFKMQNWGLLHKIVCFETYLPVGMFWGGRYVLQKGKRTYSH